MSKANSSELKERVRIGKRLRELRQQARLTQEEVGLRAGFSSKYVSEIERGHRDPPLSTLNALASAVGGSLEGLLRTEKFNVDGLFLFHATPHTMNGVQRLFDRLPKAKHESVLGLMMGILELALMEDDVEKADDWFE